MPTQPNSSLQAFNLAVSTFLKNPSQLLPNLTTGTLLRRRATVAHPPLNHTRQHLECNLRSSQSRNLSAPIKSRRNLHHIRPDNIQPLNPPQNPNQLPRAPSAGLRSSSPRRQTGIDDININAEVHGRVEADMLKNLARDRVRAHVINIISSKADPAL